MSDPFEAIQKLMQTVLGGEAPEESPEQIQKKMRDCLSTLVAARDQGEATRNDIIANSMKNPFQLINVLEMWQNLNAGPEAFRKSLATLNDITLAVVLSFARDSLLTSILFGLEQQLNEIDAKLAGNPP